MKLVRLIKDWHWPDIFRQTPNHSAEWGGISYTLLPVEECDYVVVLNRVPSRTNIRCAPEKIWAVIQEPPVPEYAWLQKGFGKFNRVYTPDTSLNGEKYLHSHGALPWHVDMDYDELRSARPVEKKQLLSWVTSAKTGRVGHRRRMTFLSSIQNQVTFDLWGRGFRPLDNKWDGMAPYRYSLAIENHCGPHYWTEKLADCFLSWTMPIYYGCTNIDDYFPAESFVSIDIDDPHASERLNEIIHSDLWAKNRDAIEHSRNLVLEKYQFFPFITREIIAFEKQPQLDEAKRTVLPALRDQYPRSPAAYLRRYAGKIYRWLYDG